MAFIVPSPPRQAIWNEPMCQSSGSSGWIETPSAASLATYCGLTRVAYTRLLIEAVPVPDPKVQRARRMAPA